MPVMVRNTKSEGFCRVCTKLHIYVCNDVVVTLYSLVDIRSLGVHAQQ